jgi:hypothetical protein
MVDAFLVDVVGKPLRHNPRPRYGEAVELHLRTHHSTIRAVLFFCGATAQIGPKPPSFGGF